ncbi:MAG TPA: zinc ABC transporter substrate-binding protein, partial [Gemmata sp.]|nr:zinc ABC transporter substrate-binding protein [Gemmata sp.]
MRWQLLSGVATTEQRGIRIVGLLTLLSLGLTGCGGGSGPPRFEGLPVRVTCTTTIVGDVVKRVGSDRVEVELLMGAGVDPHKYIPEPSDRTKLDSAHLVFFNGLHLEGKMADLFEKNRDRWRAHAVTHTIVPSKLLSAEIDGGSHDPHVWFDVELWMNSIRAVQAALTALDPAGVEVYRTNADIYLKELAALNNEVHETLAKLPKERRVLVTSHDAFNYFGRAYGFEVIGLQGVSTASETGTAQRDRLANTIGQRRIPAVFAETSVLDDGLKAVLDDVRTKYKHDVRLVGGENALYSDALGPAGSPGETYPGMIRHNVKV